MKNLGQLFLRIHPRSVESPAMNGATRRVPHESLGCPRDYGSSAAGLHAEGAEPVSVSSRNSVSRTGVW